MKLTRWGGTLLIGLMLWSSWSLAAPTTAATTTDAGATTNVTTAPADSAEVRVAAFKQLLAGEFEGGLALLEKARGLGAADEQTAKALALTGEYLQLHRQAEAERQAELAASVERVKLARLAETYRDRLAKDKLGEKLFARVEAAADAVGGASEHLTHSVSTQPADLLQSVRGHLERAVREMDQAERLVGEGHGEWGKAFREACGRVRAAAKAYQRAWGEAALPQDRRVLKLASEAVQGELISAGVLISRDPLLSALAHARDAQDIAGRGVNLLTADWMKQLVADAEKRGRELIETQDWADALAIFGRGGLGDLDEDNVTYEETANRINRHVRVQNLYGPEPPGPRAASGPASTPATASRPSLEPKWRELIEGIDANMVRNAISEIDDNYVDRPDYRKIGSAGLEAIRTLASTPVVAEAFPGLRNQARRERFLAAVEEQSKQLRSRSTVDHLDVKLALTRVLDASLETVDIPPEVISLEFGEGMTSALDQFTSMIWPSEDEDFRQRTTGSFVGIGVQIRKEPGGPIEVVTPLADTPAFRMGLRAGDWIIRVGDRDTKTLALPQAVKLIKGPPDTTVTLTIKRSGVPNPFELSIPRGTIQIQTVKGWRRLPDGQWDYFLDRQAGIGCVRITQFTPTTADEVGAVLAALRKDGAKGVILDMRFNPGGYLVSAIKLADHFLHRGLIVSTKGRNVQPIRSSATVLGEYQSGKVLVLTNRYSASAAEIVAGALKDWDRALIVGERTYGKGSVQRLIGLNSRNARLRLTTAYYYLPAGRCLHRTNGAKVWGVDPHVEIPMTLKQTNRWAEIRQETDLLQDVDARKLETLLDQQLREDLQLQAALLLLRLEVLGGAT